MKLVYVDKVDTELIEKLCEDFALCLQSLADK